MKQLYYWKEMKLCTFLEKFQELNNAIKTGGKPIKLLRIYGRTHEQKDYEDPIRDITSSSSSHVEGCCLAKFRNDSLHFKIRQRNGKIKEMECQLSEQGQKGLLPPLHIQKQ